MKNLLIFTSKIKNYTNNSNKGKQGLAKHQIFFLMYYKAPDILCLKCLNNCHRGKETLMSCSLECAGTANELCEREHGMLTGNVFGIITSDYQKTNVTYDNSTATSAQHKAIGSVSTASYPALPQRSGSYNCFI